MSFAEKNMLHERYIETGVGFYVYYYLTTSYFDDALLCDDTAKKPYYGVLLEKRGNDGAIESAGVSGVSEDQDEARQIIEILYDMSVTPISLYEVVDVASERAGCRYGF